MGSHEHIPTTIMTTVTEQPYYDELPYYPDDGDHVDTNNNSNDTVMSLSMLFPDDCVDMNRLLWALRRDPTSRTLTASVFAFIYSMIIVVGVCGNICVLLAIGRTRSLQTVSNLFIFALSCSDIVVCCVSATFTPYTAFRKVWVFGTALCSLVPFIAGTSLCFSTFILAAISVDRFLLIRFPLNNQLRHRHAITIIMLICLLAMVLSLPMLFTQKLLTMEGYCGEFCFEVWGSNELYREIYGTLLLIVQFFIPLGVISICYVGISLRLSQNILLRRKKMGNSWHHHHQRLADRRRQRTNRMFVLMVCAFILSWIWSVLFNILRDFGLLPHFIAEQEFLYGIITHSIAMTSTIWNPILYALLNLQLRSAFLQLVPKGLRKLLTKGHKFDSKSGGARSGGNNKLRILPSPIAPSGNRRLMITNEHRSASMVPLRATPPAASPKAPRFSADQRIQPLLFVDQLF